MVTQQQDAIDADVLEKLSWFSKGVRFICRALRDLALKRQLPLKINAAWLEASVKDLFLQFHIRRN